MLPNRALLRVCLRFIVFVGISVAVPHEDKKNFQDWIHGCKCSCLTKTQNWRLLLPNCATKETFRIDRKNNLHHIYSSLLPALNITSTRLLSCETGLKDKIKINSILLNLRCKENNTLNTYYVLKKEKHRTKLKTAFKKGSSVSGLDNLPSTAPTKHEKKEFNGEPSKKLVVGLSIGLSLLFIIIAIWMWTRWRIRRRRKKAVKKGQNPVHGYIDEEEDSVPYRIVDLQTHISCDALGYTFLEAKQENEERPYQKLQPQCNRTCNRKIPKEDKNKPHQHVLSKCSKVDQEQREEEERPYQQLEPTCSERNEECANENRPFEDVVDEPVYFLLESNTSPNSS